MHGHSPAIRRGGRKENEKDEKVCGRWAAELYAACPVCRMFCMFYILSGLHMHVTGVVAADRSRRPSLRVLHVECSICCMFCVLHVLYVPGVVLTDRIRRPYSHVLCVICFVRLACSVFWPMTLCLFHAWFRPIDFDDHVWGIEYPGLYAICSAPGVHECAPSITNEEALVNCMLCVEGCVRGFVD